MTDDLVKRLRDESILERFENGHVSQMRNPDGPEAANRIEKLEAALRMVIDWDNTLDLEDGPDWDAVMGTACKALEGKDD
jgi:hypothetical protein